jgi:thioesterase domain-containing protein/acyl carrier protein
VLDAGADLEGDGAMPVGLAVPDVDISLLDDSGRPVAPGEAGEVAVSSPYLFAGYWGHPELNRRVLSDDPQRRPGWHRYRTGDFGRIDAEGRVTILGRVDTRVKVRGRPVVLGDVEVALQQLDGVADAAVVAHQPGGIVELVAHVVPRGDPLPTAATLRAELLEQHEAYRVPSRWLLHDELPRLPNGKVDRRALPTVGHVDVEAVEAVARGSADRSSLRDHIRSIWERLLPIGAVDVDEDFADIGGDSLLAAQMLLVVEDELGVVVPMGELVHARTVRQLADVVSRMQQSPADATTAACVTTGDEDGRPRLWFVHDLHGSAYRLRHLAAALGDDQPLWSFESPLLRGEPNHFTMLATFVARYLTDLRAAQPEGPYWLSGYSFGGICAYEMARQLTADGEEVAFLGVVDVGPGYRGPGWSRYKSPLRPWFGVAQPPPQGASAAAIARHYAHMVRTSPRGAARHLMVQSGAARVIDPLRFRSDLRKHGAVRKEWRLWYAWEEHWKVAAKGWDRSSTYGGKLDLFWADGSGASDGTMGWGPLVGELVIHRFAGNHETLLEPSGAPALAKMLRDAVDQAMV